MQNPRPPLLPLSSSLLLLRGWTWRRNREVSQATFLSLLLRVHTKHNFYRGREPITPLIFKYQNQSPEVTKVASTKPPSCFQFAAAAARSRRCTVTAGALGGSFPVGAKRLGDRTVCIYVIKTPGNSNMRFRNYFFLRKYALPSLHILRVMSRDHFQPLGIITKK